LLINHPAIFFILLTFAPVWSPSAGGVKREVRCDSGAIPVAVKPPKIPPQEGFESKIVEELPLSQVNRDGKVSTKAKPEDLPDQQTTCLPAGRHSAFG
jgi:hypothetical protein